MLLVFGSLFFPAGLVFLCQRVPVFDRIGVVLLSFAAGIAIAAGLDLSQLFSLDRLAIQGIQTQISEVSVALAIPLLLFSIDIKAAFNMAGNTLKGMGFALVSVIIASLGGALLFKDQVDQIWQVAGMAVGAYTGGGPNMAAIKTAIHGDESIFITMVTYDILFSAVYLLFVMTMGKRIFGRFLQPYESSAQTANHGYQGMKHMADETAHAYKKLVEKNKRSHTLYAMICSGLVVGLSLLIAGLFPESMKSSATIITITTLGIISSFIPWIRALENSFSLGMYLVLIFCFTMGTMTDTNILMNIDYSLAGYIIFLLMGSLFLQLVLCKIFRVDTNTYLITSSAAIMSVPFIPVIAEALKNRALLVPGFAAAILGYAAGNYLGILVANSSRWMLNF
ncbi:MAG: DUF819 family protein [Desulfobacter sp.]|nr:DUF819 family protein [Desulfobacter sp.]